MDDAVVKPVDLQPSGDVVWCPPGSVELIGGKVLPNERMSLCLRLYLRLHLKLHLGWHLRTLVRL